MKSPKRIWLLLAALAVALPAAAQDEPADSETVAYLPDETSRMTVPVNITGSGPYRFLVDTGSERTIISRELAQQLRLEPGATAVVHSMTEVSDIRTAIIPSLDLGVRRVRNIHAPMLERRHLGAEGLLGIDSLQSQRVVLDFVRGEMTISPSRREEGRWPEGTIVVNARSRYGHLMLVDASFDGERVYVIVDTGAQITVANNALRRRLERRRRLGPLLPVEITSVTGGTIDAEYGIAGRITIGGAGIRNLPVAFADANPFRQLDLLDRPAMLLGMDALQLFDRVSFDFASRRVRLLLPETSQLDRDVRIALIRRTER